MFQARDEAKAAAQWLHGANSTLNASASVFDRAKAFSDANGAYSRQKEASTQNVSHMSQPNRSSNSQPNGSGQNVRRRIITAHLDDLTLNLDHNQGQPSQDNISIKFTEA